MVLNARIKCIYGSITSPPGEYEALHLGDCQRRWWTGTTGSAQPIGPGSHWWSPAARQEQGGADGGGAPLLRGGGLPEGPGAEGQCVCDYVKFSCDGDAVRFKDTMLYQTRVSQ
ncbi:unnamed protein product [Lota lota]